MSNYPEIEKKVNELLCGTCIESFGIGYQVPYITFINNSGQDYTLHIQGEAYWNLPNKLDSFSLDFLTGALKANLMQVQSVQLFEDNDLTVLIGSNLKLTVKGTDERSYVYECWSLMKETDSHDQTMIIIIASNGGDIACWY